MDHPCLEVEHADVHDLGIEDLLDPVADQVVHRLHVQVLGEALLDAVDQGELGGALVGLGQQALRLVEEPRVLQRHAEAAGQRHQQPHIALRECVFMVQVLERDDTSRFATGDQGRVHAGLGHLAGYDAFLAILLDRVVHVLVEHQRFTRFQHRPAWPDDRH